VARVPNYLFARTKSEKGQVIVDIVEQLQKDSPSGVGFVKQNPNNGKWYYIGTERAKDKIGHALRKAAQEGEKKETSGEKKRKQPPQPSVPIAASADGGGKDGDIPSAQKAEGSHHDNGNGNPYIKNARLGSARTLVDGTPPPPPNISSGAAFTHQSTPLGSSSNSGWDPSHLPFMTHLRPDASLPMTHSPYGYPHLGYPVSPTTRGGSSGGTGGPEEQQRNFDFPAAALTPALNRQQGGGEMMNGPSPTSPSGAPFLFSSSPTSSNHRGGGGGGGVYQQSQQHQEQPSSSPYPLHHDQQQQQQQLTASIRNAYPSLTFGSSNFAPGPYPQQRYHPPPIRMDMRPPQRTNSAVPDNTHPLPSYESLRNTTDNMRRPHQEQRRPENDHASNPLYYSGIYGYSPRDPRGGWDGAASKLKHQQD
jgi:hypothetical protein